MVKNIEKKTEEKNPIMEKTNKRIFTNIFVAILIMVYFVGVYIAYDTLQKDIFERCLQVLTMTLLAIAIIIFEISYKQDNGLLALSGIEALIIACHALAIPYITAVCKWDLRWYVTISGYAFAIYFVFKSIVVYTEGRKEYLNSFSDISEIVKEEKPTKKVAVKRKKKEEA